MFNKPIENIYVGTGHVRQGPALLISHAFNKKLLAERLVMIGSY